MRSSFLITVLFLFALVLPCQAQELTVTFEISKSGELLVEERWTRLEPDQTPLKRTLYLNGWPGHAPLRQRITQVEGPVEHRLDYGFDKAFFRFEEMTEVVFRYRVHGVAESGEGGSKADYTLRLYDQEFPLHRLRVRFREGERLDAFVYDADFAENLFLPTVQDDGHLSREASAVPGGRAARFVLYSQVSPESPGAAEYGYQFQTGLYALAAAAVVGAVLLFCPAGMIVEGARFFNLSLLGLTAYLLWPLFRFDLLAPQYSGGEWWLNFFSVLVVYLGLLGVLAATIFAQDKNLATGRPEAYTLQLTLPVLFFLPTPAAQVEPSFLLLPVAASLLLPCWVARSLGRHLGADSHLVVEIVETEGEIELTELARRYGVSPRRLRAILKHQRELPVVVNFQTGVVYSPATASLLKSLSLCTSCGGAVQVKGQQQLHCPYCDREYAKSMEVKPQKPVPSVVSAYAGFMESVGLGICAWTALLVVVGFLDEAYHTGLGSAVMYSFVVALIGFVVGLIPIGLAEGLRVGHQGYYKPLLYSLGLLTPRSLRTERVELHFGIRAVDDLKERLKQEGTLTIAQLSEMLECSLSEAAELARYLVSSQELEAVYDRVGERLIEKERFEQLASEESCRSCGGILGITGDRVVCQHCGEEVSG